MAARFESSLAALFAVLAPPLLAAACTSNDARPNEVAFAQARSEKPHDDNPQIPPDQAETLSADNHALALDLYHQLRDGQAAGKGFSISPYSIQTAFGMLYGGSIDPARVQMRDTLHFSIEGEQQHVAHNWIDAQLASRNLPESDSEVGEWDPVILQTANGVWVLDDLQARIAKPFLDLLAIHYDAGVFLAQFDSQPEVEREGINAWVAARTRDLIPELFPSGIITDDTKMVLVNALYLKAPWSVPFREEQTSKQPFTRIDGTSVDVQMMHADQLEAGYAAGAGYQALAVPLRGDALELVVILPDDLAAFEASLDPVSLDAILDGLSTTIVDTQRPRFELDAELELSNELRALGMPAPFDDMNSFDAILDDLGVITAVVHQTVIEVDEKGVEAAAATGIVITESSSPEPQFSVVIDRPFMLAIRDAPTDTLLFLGRVLDPTGEVD
jgi:serpin B